MRQKVPRPVEQGANVQHVCGFNDKQERLGSLDNRDGRFRFELGGVVEAVRGFMGARSRRSRMIAA